jgi:ribosomal protein S27E
MCALNSNPSEPTHSEVLQVNCPDCGNENTQRLSIVYKAGTTNTQAAGEMSAIHVPLGNPYGVSSINGTFMTACRDQSDLAKLAAPPTRPDLRGSGAATAWRVIGASVAVIWGVWTCCAGGRIVSAAVGSGVIFGVTLIGESVLRGMHRPGRDEVRALQLHAERKEQWRRSFICLRCGRIFIPSDGSNQKANAASAMQRAARLFNQLTLEQKHRVVRLIESGDDVEATKQLCFLTQIRSETVSEAMISALKSKLEYNRRGNASDDANL